MFSSTFYHVENQYENESDMNKWNVCVCVCVSVCLSEWMNEWMNEWINEIVFR